MFLQKYKITFLTHVVFLFKRFSLICLLFWNTSSFSISFIYLILKKCALFLINCLNLFAPFCRGHFPKSWPLFAIVVPSVVSIAIHIAYSNSWLTTSPPHQKYQQFGWSVLGWGEETQKKLGYPFCEIKTIGSFKRHTLELGEGGVGPQMHCCFFLVCVCVSVFCFLGFPPNPK